MWVVLLECNVDFLRTRALRKEWVCAYGLYAHPFICAKYLFQIRAIGESKDATDNLQRFFRNPSSFYRNPFIQYTMKEYQEIPSQRNITLWQYGLFFITHLKFYPQVLEPAEKYNGKNYAAHTADCVPLQQWSQWMVLSLFIEGQIKKKDW